MNVTRDAWTRLHQNLNAAAGSFAHYPMPVKQAKALVDQVVLETSKDLRDGSLEKTLEGGWTQRSALEGWGDKVQVQSGWEHRPMATRLDEVFDPSGQRVSETYTSVFENNGVKVFHQISQTPEGTAARQFDFNYVGASGEVTVQEWFTPTP